MESTIVRVEAHITDVRRALWCRNCLLPSRIEADFALVWADSLKVFGRYSGSWCDGCGQ